MLGFLKRMAPPAAPPAAKAMLEPRHRKLCNATNGLRRDVIGPAQFPDGLPLSFPFPNFIPLVRSQLVLSAHPNTPALGPFAAFSSPGLNQLAFELGKAA